MRVSGDREQRMAAVARLQRGRVARKQLLAAGIAQTTISNMVRRRLLQPEHSGVYVIGSAPPVPLARETAALLACHGAAVLSHESAAALWGLMQFPEGPVQVTVVGGETGRKRRGIEFHRAKQLLDRDVAIHLGIPVTSPARTLLDLASYATARELERALDEALVVRRIVPPEELDDVAERARGRRGTGLFRQLVADRGGTTITHSEAERRFLQLMRAAALPEPKTQVRVAGFTVDFFWPEQRVAFEVDGFRFHTSRSSFDRDRRKDAALKAAGVDPNRVSRDQVKYQSPMVVAHVAAALARAGTHR